jgi:hypothetical protein
VQAATSMWEESSFKHDVNLLRYNVRIIVAQGSGGSGEVDLPGGCSRAVGDTECGRGAGPTLTEKRGRDALGTGEAYE